MYDLCCSGHDDNKKQQLSLLLRDLVIAFCLREGMSRPFVCPYPLVWANASLPIKEEFEVHWAYEEGNCAIRCPSITFTESEMSTFFSHMKWISGTSCIVSSMILLYYIRDVEKRFLMVMFLLGFWLESIAFFLIFPFNDNYALICDDESHFVPEAPICVMQSFMLIYSFIWVMSWGAIYTIDIYFQVQFKMGAAEIKKYRPYYFAFVFIAATGITSIPLAAGNLGYDYSTSLQTCIYLFGDQQAFFWLTLVLPFTVMICTSFFFSILTFKRLHLIFVGSELRQNKRFTKAQDGRLVSDVNSAQDEYTQRVRFNYWSSDGLDNEFDSDGNVTIKSTIVNPLSGDVELSNSSHTYGDNEFYHYEEEVQTPSESVLSIEDRIVQEELEAARKSVAPARSHNTLDLVGRITEMGRETRDEDMGRQSSVGTRMSSVSVSPNDSPKKQSFQRMSNMWICLKKTWKYNGWMMLFLFFFCAVAIFILPSLVYLYYTKYDQYIHGTENYVECLVTASFTSPLQTQEAVDFAAHAECGSHPSYRPPFSLFMSVSYYAACFGLVPLLLFGKAPFNYFINKFSGSHSSTNNSSLKT